MTVHTVPAVSHLSTQSIDPADRVDYWEEYNRKALVGLTCSPYSEQGLLATQTNVPLGGLRLADIAGNEHVIERTPGTCRALPKDSVFATLLVTGQAVFFHGAGCLTLRAGDLVLYDTRRSYLFGFPCTMRQLLVDIPGEVFTERCAAGGVFAPMVFGRDSAAEGVLVSSLRSVLTDWAAGGGAGDPVSTEATVLDLVRSLAAPRLGERVAPLARPSQLAVAKDYADRQLSDPRLCAEHVAEAVGVSTRHLSRIFAPSGVSPSRYILEQRLVKAREQLADPQALHLTIADIAHRWGFASQAHFTRVFRDRFEQTPGEARPAPVRTRPPHRS
ncbi:helix-turn-helix domain-containing protein [Streptomyces zagrosensis]|uniref:AraC-like DNA-binding protein n=1 Tax=Streptomyces zagrosensis TaxID=1042984 RepID=A0A7W9QEV0_9ACTN|nr:helix-turn-helix domain-containing protein [Streptomyces zagrosensis]MBB5938709.1 AraC-like DNA-binding protein [Streptomyces zagrosensis]